MDALRYWKRAARFNVLEFESKPYRRVMTTPQARYRNDASAFEALHEVELDPIQNADGTFKFMLGYSALGGDDPLG